MKPALILATVALALVSLTVQAGQPSDDAVRKLLQVTGSAQMGEQMLQAIMPNLKQMVPDASEKFWTEVSKDIKSEDMISRLIPIYKKALSASDVDGIIKFYESSAGKNLVKALPSITQESMMAGQQWGQEIAQKVMTKYQKEQKK